MELADYVIRNYMKKNGLKKIDDAEALRRYLEDKYDKPMPRRLFVAMGNGGGNSYKLLWNVMDARNNRNRACYFHTDPKNKSAIRELQNEGHISVEEWINSSERGR